MFSIFANSDEQFKHVDKAEPNEIPFDQYLANARKTLDLIAVDIEIADLLRLKSDVDSINESRAVLERATANYKAYQKMFDTFPPKLGIDFTGLDGLNELYKLHKYAKSIKQDMEEVYETTQFISQVSYKR